MPVLTPGPTTSGSWPRYWRASATSTGVRGGTTLASATASMPAGSKPRAREQVAHQDAVLVGRLLAARGEAPVHEQRPPSKTPSTVFVLPTSIVRSMPSAINPCA